MNAFSWLAVVWIWTRSSVCLSLLQFVHGPNYLTMMVIGQVRAQSCENQLGSFWALPRGISVSMGRVGLTRNALDQHEPNPFINQVENIKSNLELPGPD